MSLPQPGAYVDTIKAATTPGTSCFGVVALNFLQELKITLPRRGKWSKVSASHMLAALIAF
jgi:hypothetical protein